VGKKFDRCVEKVEKSLMKSGGKGNPFAICKASLNKSNRRKK